MIDIHEPGAVPRCQAMTVAMVHGAGYSVQCEDAENHIGSHNAAISKHEIWVWPSEDDVRDAQIRAEHDAMSDEQIMLLLTGGDKEEEARVKEWSKASATFVHAGLKMRAEIDELKAQLKAAELEMEDLRKGWRHEILEKGQAWQEIEDVRKLLAKERQHYQEMQADYEKHFERYEATAKDHDKTREELYAVLATAIEMRKGHEGCVTDPPCGACFRCDFDKAVDAWLEKNP